MKETISQMNSLVVYGLLFLLTLIAASLLLSISSSAKKESRSGSKKKSGRFGSRRGCLSVLSLALVMIALLSFTAYIRAFHSFTKQELVAIVECRPTELENADFELVLVPVRESIPGEEMIFIMQGDQWAIGGDILKWHSSLNFLGLHTMYRLTRVEGRYETAQEAQNFRASAYSLVKEEQSSFWQTLYKIGEKLPLVHSAYGNTVYTYPSYRDFYLVSVTTSGFMIEKAKNKKTTMLDYLQRFLR